jgi:hypothetical protein
MNIASKIAAFGEDPAFVAFNAHCWFAFSLMSVCRTYLAPLHLATFFTLTAFVKEFWFDLRYESTPRQTVLDSLHDFVGYAFGICLGYFWFI